ncbi:hypothetical protein HYPGJ_31618 [Hyphomicrobium sp. GJ21]|nr:hypothetical protein HYPGJ_31618 [Hyphomicrobium sp. GJ21]
MKLEKLSPDNASGATRPGLIKVDALLIHSCTQAHSDNGVGRLVMGEDFSKGQGGHRGQFRNRGLREAYRMYAC